MFGLQRESLLQSIACGHLSVVLLRYDKLVGMFSGKDVPAVGISIGIERVFKILQVLAPCDSLIVVPVPMRRCARGYQGQTSAQRICHRVLGGTLSERSGCGLEVRMEVQDQMEAEAKTSGGFIRSTATDVLVASIGKGLQRQRMRVASLLWEAGVAVSSTADARPALAASHRMPQPAAFCAIVCVAHEMRNRAYLRNDQTDSSMAGSLIS